MEAFCSLQSVLRSTFMDFFHLAVSRTVAPTIVPRVSPRTKGPCCLDVILAVLPVIRGSLLWSLGNTGRGLRSFPDLTEHLTARADDSHAAPVSHPRRSHVSVRFQRHVKPWLVF